jgi:hypothetical protein
MNNKYYFEYTDLDLSHLKKWELELIELFKEVTQLCGEIYDGQINTAAGFYPKNASIDEIEDAAVDDANILSPYTRVIRDGAKLKAVFYYDEFSDQINKIAELLKKAEGIYSKNNFKEYADYLKQLVVDLKSANFESSEKRWLKINGEANVDIKLGPLETYQDKILGIKRVFQANLRIRDEQEYSNLTDYIDVINAILPASPFAKDVSQSEFVVRIDKVVAMGGWHADLFPSASNYPSDINYTHLGVKAIIYTNNMSKKQPMVNEIARKIIDSSYNDPKKLEEARTKVIIFHEISEAISKLKYKTAYNQLRNYRDHVIEVYADLMGLKSGSVHVLKGVISTEDYQYILVAYLASMLRTWAQGRSNNSVSVYSDGDKLVFNYFLQREAIKIYENKIQIDYAKMYSAIDNLVMELSHIILNRDAKGAEEIFSKYGSDKEITKFEGALKEIIESN